MWIPTLISDPVCPVVEWVWIIGIVIGIAPSCPISIIQPLIFISYQHEASSITMNLWHLKQFVAPAETGNFHKAAGLMHMAQPPLSVCIRKLQEEMGGAPFLRTSVGVLLTAAGEAMLRCQQWASFRV